MNFELSPYSLSSSREPWKMPLKPTSTSVLIDSRDRSLERDPNANQYRIKLPKTLRNVSSCRLVTAEIPGSFYVFHSNRSNVSLRVTAGGASARTVQIPNGNYTGSSIATGLQGALNTAFTADGVTFSVSVSETTNKISIASSSHPSDPVVVDCSDGQPGVGSGPSDWGLGYYLGFPKATTTGTGLVTGTRIVLTKPEAYLLLKIKGLDTVLECGLNGSTELLQCFAKIPFNIASNSFSVAYFDKLITDNVLNPIVERLQWLDISLCFHDGSLVEFEGAEHSFTLEFYTAPATV